jgi:hypothetical protein
MKQRLSVSFFPHLKPRTHPMKISILPTTAVAFTVLSIIAVVFNRVGLTHLETVWPALTAYSAVIAEAAWFDRRSAQRVEAPHPLHSNDTAAA